MIKMHNKSRGIINNHLGLVHDLSWSRVHECNTSSSLSVSKTTVGDTPSQSDACTDCPKDSPCRVHAISVK